MISRAFKRVAASAGVATAALAVTLGAAGTASAYTVISTHSSVLACDLAKMAAKAQNPGGDYRCIVANDVSPTLWLLVKW